MSSLRTRPDPGRAAASPFRRVVFAAALGILACATLLPAVAASKPGTPARGVVETLPPQISDAAFWQMIKDFSEPSGYFRSDNFLSNEHAFQEVIPRFRAAVPKGGVYLGVGPEQNFTYVAALRPKLAFIIDIRRQNMIEQLLYKALFELSADRVEFVSRLFARKRPTDLDVTSSVDALFEGLSSTPKSEELFAQTLRAVKERLVKDHHLALTTEDLKSLEYVYNTFYTVGPEIAYTFTVGQFSRGRFPTYTELMTETDANGEQHGYLATEEHFRILKGLQSRNLIVPLVGDFSGDKVLRSVARYLREHDAPVTAFYISNVEQYLFEDGTTWRRFLANMALFPLDNNSTLLRSVSNRGFQFRLGLIADLLAAFREGKIETYADAIALSQ